MEIVVEKHFILYGNKLKNGNVIFKLQMDGKYMPRSINDGDKIISKTYMNIVVGENTRLRHYLAEGLFTTQNNSEKLKHSIPLLIH
ncbi:MAG: hypothetical protein O4751_16705 [Trichodesmium sp. St2_bin6]|nr:hypothetical protein [Trichodesmium sp. St2_bin6]